MAKRALFIVLLSSFACFTALFAAGLALPNPAMPKDGGIWFENIGRDNWITSDSAIVVEHLAAQGNSVTLKFNPWRPEGTGSAHVVVNMCGEVVAQFIVEKNSPLFNFPYKPKCEGGKLGFEVKNPFTPGNGDERLLGAQLESVALHSKIGPPLVAPDRVFLLAGVFLLPALLLFFAYPLKIGAIAGVIAVLGEAVLFVAQWGVNATNLSYLWSFVVLLAAGIALGRNGSYDSSQNEEEDISQRAFVLFSVLVVALAGAFRFYGLDFGLPANYHPDEVPKVMAVERMIANGDLNPRYFLHPSLLLYLTYGVSELLQYLGMSGEWQTITVFAGRTVSALAGTLSVLVLLLISRKLCSRSGALLSGILLATMPLHVTCSRYLKEDSLLTFFVLLCTLAAITAAESKRVRYMYLAGLLAGIATSSKYSGLLCVAIVGAVPWLVSQRFIPDRQFLKHLPFALMLLPLGFVLCTPYSVLHSSKFLKDFNYERRHMEKGHTASITAWSQLWMYHLSRSIIPGVHVVIASISAVAVGVLVRSWRIAGLFVVCCILLFYLPAEWVRAKPAPQPERYILPCLPFLALAVPFAMKHLRLRVWAVVPLMLLLVPTSLYQSGVLTLSIQDDTRKQMGRWMSENLPEKSKIYVDWKRYGPEVDEKKFEVSYLPRTNTLQALHVNNIKKTDNDYLVLSSLYIDRYFSQPNASPAEREIIRGVFRQLKLVKEFDLPGVRYGFHNPKLSLLKIH